VDFSIDIQRAGKTFGVKGRFVDMAHIFTSLFLATYANLRTCVSEGVAQTIAK